MTCKFKPCIVIALPLIWPIGRIWERLVPTKSVLHTIQREDDVKNNGRVVSLCRTIFTNYGVQFIKISKGSYFCIRVLTMPQI
jgi:hypothetical protein